VTATHKGSRLQNEPGGGVKGERKGGKIEGNTGTRDKCTQQTPAIEVGELGRDCGSAGGGAFEKRSENGEGAEG